MPRGLGVRISQTGWAASDKKKKGEYRLVLQTGVPRYWAEVAATNKTSGLAKEKAFVCNFPHREYLGK